MKYSLFFTIVFFLSIQAYKAQWTVILYMEAEDFADMPLKHINDMLSAYKLLHTKQHIHILIQVHTTGPTAWRYILEEGKLRYLGEILLSLRSAQDMEDYLVWALKQYPSQHTMIILSGHGYGILEPLWDKHKEMWSLPFKESCEVISEKYYKFIDLIDHESHKGVLSRKVPQGYVSLQEVEHILQKVISLLGRPIDIVGIDACAMGMLEIAYIFSFYAHYYIASQECIDKEGWNYKGVIEALYDNKEPYQVARSIVYTYSMQCKQKARSRYTLAALDLGYIACMKEHINTVIPLLEKCRHYYKEVFGTVLLKARLSGPQFCFASCYKDLYSLYESLLACIEPFEYSREKEELMQELLRGLVVLNQSVLAQATSYNLREAHGLSVYFPEIYDNAYKKLRYAQETYWDRFIESLFFQR